MIIMPERSTGLLWANRYCGNRKRKKKTLTRIINYKLDNTLKNRQEIPTNSNKCHFRALLTMHQQNNRLFGLLNKKMNIKLALSGTWSIGESKGAVPYPIT